MAAVRTNAINGANCTAACPLCSWSAVATCGHLAVGVDGAVLDPERIEHLADRHIDRASRAVEHAEVLRST